MTRVGQLLAAIAEPDNLRLALWDDFVVWGESASDLRAVWREVPRFLSAELRLQLQQRMQALVAFTLPAMQPAMAAPGARSIWGGGQRARTV